MKPGIAGDRRGDGAAARPPIWLLGGGPDCDRARLTDLLRVALAEACPSPAVAYVGAAHDDHPGFYGRMRARLLAAGAGAVTLAPSDAPSDAAAACVARADVVFISGGDVAAGMRRLAASRLTDALLAAHARGACFIGLSAGSLMLARAWIEWRDPDDDATARVFPCLGFAPLLCDAHAEADDWVELRALLARQPAGTVGYGIPSDGAIRVDARETVTSCGEAPVLLRRE